MKRPRASSHGCPARPAVPLFMAAPYHQSCLDPCRRRKCAHPTAPVLQHYLPTCANAQGQHGNGRQLGDCRLHREIRCEQPAATGEHSAHSSGEQHAQHATAPAQQRAGRSNDLRWLGTGLSMEPRAVLEHQGQAKQTHTFRACSTHRSRRRAQGAARAGWALSRASRVWAVRLSGSGKYERNQKVCRGRFWRGRECHQVQHWSWYPCFALLTAPHNLELCCFTTVRATGLQGLSKCRTPPRKPARPVSMHSRPASPLGAPQLPVCPAAWLLESCCGETGAVGL